METQTTTDTKHAMNEPIELDDNDDDEHDPNAYEGFCECEACVEDY